MSYDSWKTTDPGPDVNDRDELDDYDRADMDDSEIEFLEERIEEKNDTWRQGVAKLREAKFWQNVNALALEFPEFRIEVIHD